ncbi:MAG: tyrosine-type recombinase/integrase [Oligoflexus sp.]
MDLHAEILENFIKDLQAKGKKPATVESYHRDAKEFLAYIYDIGMSMEDVAPETMLAYQNHLAAFDKENSIRRKVIGARHFFRFISDHRGQAESPLDHVPIPERLELLPLQLPRQFLQKLVQKLDKQGGLKSKRDLAILHLLALEGLKATELIDLLWVDWLPGKASGSLRIRGGRSRTIVLQPETNQTIKQYHAIVEGLKKRTRRDFPNVFIAFKGRDAGTILDHVTRHGLKFLLYELGELIGVDKLNTELLRHHAVQYHLAQGRSPEEIMNHFGLRRLGNIAKHQSQRSHSLN